MRCAAIIVIVLAQAALGQVERVEIIGAESSAAGQEGAAPEGGRDAPVALLLGAAAALATGSAAGWWAWRRWARLSDAERAFLLLCLRRGARHGERQRLREEAGVRGVSAIAELIIGGGAPRRSR